MSDTTNSNGFEGEGSHAAFERMLDAFGADARRWPTDRRSAAEALLRRQDAAGADARRALAEARALDRALAATPVFANDRLASMASRIAAEARAPLAKPNVVPLRSAERSTPQRSDPRTVAPYRQWMAAAMLAASLLVGVVIGPGSTGLPALHDAADAIGLGGYVDQLASAPAEDDGSPDEDVL